MRAGSRGSSRSPASRRWAASTSRSAPTRSNKDLAFDAAACLANGKSQLTAGSWTGCPRPLEPLHEQGRHKGVSRLRPAGQGIDRGGGPRPITPAYQDVSSAIQQALHPPEKIDPEDTGSLYDELKSNLEDAVKREGLL